MNEPLVQINFYAGMTTMTRMERGSYKTYVVSADLLAAQFSEHTLMSGLLPVGTLGWGIKRGQVWCVRLFGGCVRPVLLGMDEVIQLPLPPTVVIGHGTAWQIYAVDTEEVTAETVLYRCPAPNVSGDGGAICRGNTPFPVASPDGMLTASNAFWGSAFNAHSIGGKCQTYPRDVRPLWRELDGEAQFPLDELVVTESRLTVGSLVNRA